EEEICGDGIDNDADLLSDCYEPGCEDHESCVESRYEGALEPCEGTVDSWLLELEVGSRIHVDTVDFDTAFDVITDMAVIPLDYTPETIQSFADDDMACTFRPPDYGCPSAWLAAGTYELMVVGGSCRDASIGGYTVIIEGEGTARPILDNEERWY
ncbi:MAG: hypothetical protein ACI9K2_005826, partial [Myxococcota bacterium]